MISGVHYDVPFYPNPDDSHCVQATFKMVIKYFLEEDISFDELDRLSRKSPGKGTWTFPALIEMKKMGLRIKNIEPFDYQECSDCGECYVRKAYPAAQANYYIENSNLLEVVDAIPEFLKEVRHETREASIGELEQLLPEGWLVSCEINANLLSGKQGFNGHMVLVVGFDKENVYLNDPGLPGIKDRRVSKPDFLAASGGGGLTLTAFKREI